MYKFSKKPRKALNGSDPVSEAIGNHDPHDGWSCPHCGVSGEDIVVLASLCAEFDIGQLPEATRKARKRAVECNACRSRLRSDILKYLAQSVADEAYEARRMDEFLDFSEGADSIV